MRFFLFCVTILVGFSACKKEDSDTSYFKNCDPKNILDSAEVFSKLIGSWNWSEQACSDGSITKERLDKPFKVVFLTNHTFSVYENAVILTQGTWKIVQLNGISWALDLSSPSEYLRGRIIFCDKQVLFSFGYLDGCDNLFNKDE